MARACDLTRDRDVNAGIGYKHRTGDWISPRIGAWQDDSNSLQETPTMIRQRRILCVFFSVVLAGVVLAGVVLAGVVLAGITLGVTQESSVGPREVPPTVNRREPEPAEIPPPQAVPPQAKFSRRTLFEGWPDPAFALFITGKQYGYIEPCGCTGLDNQKGGLARRQTLLAQLRARGWNLVPIDVGNQVRRIGVQAEIKFHTTLDALRKMKYQAVGLGPDDLRLPIGELLTELVDEDSSPLVSSNVRVLSYGASYKVLRSGGYTLGITSFLGSTEQQAIHSDEIEFSQPEDGLRKALAALKKEKCNLLVLLAHASTEETIAIAKKFPEFRIVVTAGGADEPALEPEKIAGAQSYLIQTGKKGMYVGVLGIFNDPQRPLRFQRVPLDARFADSEEMLQSLASYQQQLESMGLARLGLKPVKHPSGHRFVGSAACQDCHEQAYDKWSTTPHHAATHSISHPTERSEISRHHDPECLSCHVTGWSAQNYFPYESGYLDLKASEHLLGNGCENCHGPGSAHVAAENGDGDYTAARILALQMEMRLPLARARDRCLQCHDMDNDPDFQEEGAFKKYWKQIEHYE